MCEETERKERASSTASSSALRRHLNHVEQRTREREDIKTGIGTGGRSVRENRVRRCNDERTKERTGGVERRKIEREREKEREIRREEDAGD